VSRGVTPIRWSNLRGYNTRNTPQSLRPDIGTVCTNVELEEGALGRRRPSAVAIDLTGGPSNPIYAVAVHRPSASAAELWTFSAGGGGGSDGHRYRVGTGWAAVTLIDTPASAALLHNFGVTFNDKFFLPYDSSVNRLHLWDGTNVRRVGVAKPAAVTVADTGAGAYAATARYYRTSQRIKSGTTIVCESELSDAVSFTPSGAGAAARITKSATVDGATHWVVWGLIGTSGDTYDLYEELAEIAVATTTYDDSTNPSSYDGDHPAQLGLHIPPPSWRYMVTDGNRILGAGAWETSASAGQTVPKNSRVWFTRVLGSSDIGDDETIPNTTTQKNWIDVGENDGDAIVGLGGPVDGVVYVFKTTRVYRLIPTGIDTVPYREELVTGASGAVVTQVGAADSLNHRNITTSETDRGEPIVYYMGAAGAYRVSSATGIEFIGWDLTSPVTGLGPQCCAGVFHAAKRQQWWLSASEEGVVHCFTPQRAVATAEGWRGGWARYTLPGFTASPCMAMFEVTGQPGTVYPVIGGRLNTSPVLVYVGGTSASDAAGAFTATISSKPFLLGDDGYRNVTVGVPLLEAECEANATPAVSLVRNYGEQTRTGTCPTLSAAGSETRKSVPIGALDMSDAQAIAITVTWDSDQTKAIDAVVVPYTVKEVAA